MNQPEPEQIDYWIEASSERLHRTQMAIQNGFFKANDVPKQSIYTGDATAHASLARAKFLRGDPIKDVRAEFARAARCILKSFTMAYDPNDPDYVGDKWPPPNPQYTGKPGSVVEAKWLDPGHDQLSCGDVSERVFIEGVYYALMAADFDLARELAGWFRDPPDGVLMDPDVNRYAHGLKHAVLGEYIKAMDYLEAQLAVYEKKPPRQGYEKNYQTLITALYGIVTRDEKRFNEGLLMQLEFYRIAEAEGEYRNTPQGFICDDAVALANLGLHEGLAVTVEHDLLPRGLLIEKG